MAQISWFLDAGKIISHKGSIWIQFIEVIVIIKGTGEQSCSWLARKGCRLAGRLAASWSDEEQEWGGTSLFNRDFGVNLEGSYTGKKIMSRPLGAFQNSLLVTEKHVCLKEKLQDVIHHHMLLCFHTTVTPRRINIYAGKWAGIVERYLAWHSQGLSPSSSCVLVIGGVLIWNIIA